MCIGQRSNGTCLAFASVRVVRAHVPARPLWPPPCPHHCQPVPLRPPPAAPACTHTLPPNPNPTRPHPEQGCPPGMTTDCMHTPSPAPTPPRPPAASPRLSPCDHHRLHASVRGTVVRIRQHGNRFMGSGWAATSSRRVSHGCRSRFRSAGTAVHQVHKRAAARAAHSVRTAPTCTHCAHLKAAGRTLRAPHGTCVTQPLPSSWCVLRHAYNTQRQRDDRERAAGDGDRQPRVRARGAGAVGGSMAGGVTILSLQGSLICSASKHGRSTSDPLTRDLSATRPAMRQQVKYRHSSAHGTHA